MKKIFLSSILALLVVFPSSVLADPPTVNIPPTNAYSSVTTSNGSVTAPNFIGNLHFVGQGHITVTSSNGSQTVYFNGAPITPVGDRFGWYASNTIGNGGTKDLHLYNFSTGHGISATVGPDDFILSAVNFVNASSKSCGANAFFDSFNNATGIFVCKTVNSTSTLDTMQNLKPSQASVFAGNNTNFNFQFKGLNFTGSLSVINGSNIITIHGNQYQNNTGLNIGKGGKGVYAGNTGSILNFKNITSTRPDLISVSSNGTDVNLGSIFKAYNTTCAGGAMFSAFNNLTGVFTCTSGAAQRFTTFQNIGKGGAGVLTSSGTILQGKNITSTNSNILQVSTNATDVNLTPIITHNDVIPASYTISINKTTNNIQAVNDTTQKITYSGTDAYTVIQNAANDLIHGGTLYVKIGNYTMNNQLKLKSGTILNAEAFNIPSLINTCPACGVTLLESGNQPILNLTNVQGVTVKNILFNGGKTNSTVISNTEPVWIKGTTNVLLDRISVANSKSNGIHIKGGTETVLLDTDIGTSNNDGVYFDATSDFHMDVCKCGSNLANGIHVQDSSAGEISQVNSFSNNRGFYIHNSYTIRVVNDRANANNLEGILVFKSVANPYGTFNTITNNLLLNNGQSVPSAQIRMDGSVGLPVQNTIVTNNMIVDTQSIKTAAYGVRETTAADNNTITSNTINGTTTLGISTIGSHDIVRGNMLVPLLDENFLNKRITNLGTPTASTDADRANTLGLLGSKVVVKCSNSQVLSYQSSNTTWICTNAAVDTNTAQGNNLTSTNGAGKGIFEGRANATQLNFRTITSNPTITVTTNATNLLLNDTGTSADASFYHRTGGTNWYSINSYNSPAPITGNAIANKTWAIPMVVGHGYAVDRIQYEVTTNSAGRCMVGIYNDTGNVYPDHLVATGTDQSTASIGLKTDTISVNLKSDNLYWLAINCNNAAATLRAINLAYVPNVLGFTTSGSNTSIVGWAYTLNNPTSGFALDTTFAGGASVVTNSSPPFITIRAA